MNEPLRRAPSPDLLPRFAKIVGDRYAVTDPAALAPYLVEGRDLYHGRTAMLLRPGSVAEVAAILKLANETGTPVVPQGGNTGLVGGQIPLDGELLISLTRLDKIREVDPSSNTMTCESGVVLQKAQEAAAAADRLFPLSLGAEGSCTIGGNLSTNAGGTGALAYGIARDLMLGVEVVLADGRVLNLLRKLKKDNTGYDLRHLFVGAEGTLGIITAAVLKLFPRPRAVETAFIGLASPDGRAEAAQPGAGARRRHRDQLRADRPRHHRLRAEATGRACATRSQACIRGTCCWKSPPSTRRACATASKALLADAVEEGHRHRRHHRGQPGADQIVLAPAPFAAGNTESRKAARSSTTSRCRSPRCRSSSPRPTPRCWR